MGAEVEQILDTWLNEIGPEGWDEPNPTIDALLKVRFEKAWAQAHAGEFGAWVCQPRSCLALLILLDQMPRRMFRGTDKAYATDARALAVAKRALVMGHDQRIGEPDRRFFYLPLMHSESLSDQERCVRLMALRMPHANSAALEDAKASRNLIRQYGRFPYRNEILGRPSTPGEAAYLSAATH